MASIYVDVFVGASTKVPGSFSVDTVRSNWMATLPPFSRNGVACSAVAVPTSTPWPLVVMAAKCYIRLPGFSTVSDSPTDWVTTTSRWVLFSPVRSAGLVAAPHGGPGRRGPTGPADDKDGENSDATGGLTSDAPEATRACTRDIRRRDPVWVYFDTNLVRTPD